MDKVLTAPILGRADICPHFESAQRNADNGWENCLIMPGDGIERDVMHGVVVLLSLRDRLGKKMMHVDGEYCELGRGLDLHAALQILLLDWDYPAVIDADYGAVNCMPIDR